MKNTARKEFETACEDGDMRQTVSNSKTRTASSLARKKRRIQEASSRSKFTRRILARV